MSRVAATDETSAAVPSSRPKWLKSRSSAAAPTPPPLPQVQTTDSQPAPPRSWWQRWMLSISLFWRGMYLGWGMTTSLAIHALVVSTLAITYFTQESRIGLPVTAGFSEGQETDELDIPVDSRLDAAQGEEAAPLQFTAVTALGDNAASMSAAESLLGQLEGEGHDAGEGDKLGELGSNIKVPPSAITRGSFTVWTEPKDPKPRSKYEIVIQVKLPPSVKQYRLRDLTGMVVGTDGYRKQITFKSTERKAVKEGVVQIAITIPGAAQLVKDTIQIRSQVLDEEQTIEIIF
ncbi:hypothetical protein GC163_23210 [bacterium]|nr:hypothetical protein [bacterium]